jgi:RNA polymerase sigma-70 factor (ECF subfamily)
LTATWPQSALAEEQPKPILRELFEQHAAFVCRSLRRLGVVEADLDDMLQEVFLVVHKRLSDYEERDRVAAWLYTICARVAQAQRRKRARRRENVSADVPLGPAEPDQLRSIEQREAILLGQRLLALLPPDQREVFVLYELEDLAMREVAEAVGCPLQTAYSRLYKARERIFADVEQLRSQGAIR